MLVYFLTRSFLIKTPEVGFSCHSCPLTLDLIRLRPVEEVWVYIPASSVHPSWEFPRRSKQSRLEAQSQHQLKLVILQTDVSSQNPVCRDLLLSQASAFYQLLLSSALMAPKTATTSHPLIPMENTQCPSYRKVRRSLVLRSTKNHNKSCWWNTHCSEERKEHVLWPGRGHP